MISNRSDNIIVEQGECPMILSVGSVISLIAHAGAARAEVLCSVTNHEDHNLISCQVARCRFGVPRTITPFKSHINENVSPAGSADKSHGHQNA